MNKTQIVRGFLTRFPNTPTRTLASKIWKEQGEHFTSVDSIRAILKRCRGLNKDRGTVHKPNLSHVVDRNKFAKFERNPFSLPKSSAQKPEVFILPRDCSNILFISDLHIPYHDVNAISVALKFGKSQKVNTIFINGDLLDFYQISRFLKEGKRPSVKDELSMAREFLGILRKTFPKAKIYFLLGNHDIRLQHYLSLKAPELLDVEEFHLDVLLKCDELDIKVLPDTTLVKMGKLSVTHGHLLLRGFFAPVNAARGTFLRAKDSTIISHVHKVSSHSETTIKGKLITCFSTGCLCELNPTYSPFANNYSHGFAHILVKSNGHFIVRNYQIIDGILY